MEIVTPRKYIVNRGGAEADNDFRGVTISTTTLSGMLYLLYYTDPILTIKIVQTENDFHVMHAKT